MVNILAKGTISGKHLVRVYYEDTDLSGFVYHANYLKYFERGREHLIGVSFLAELYQNNVHFVVNKAELSFHAPSGHGDQLEIISQGVYSHSPAIVFNQVAKRLVNNARPLPCCSASITIVALNKQNKPIRLPSNLLEHFQTQYNTNSLAQ